MSGWEHPLHGCQMLMGFSIPSKVVQLMNFQQHVLFTTNTCKKPNIKLTTNPKLTCTQFIKSLKKVGWKIMIHVPKMKEWNTKSKVLKQVCSLSLILVISKHNNHNRPL
jgi:hypothetical protein